MAFASPGRADHILLPLEKNSRGCRNASLSTTTQAAVVSKGKDPLRCRSRERPVSKLLRWVILFSPFITQVAVMPYTVASPLPVDASSASEDELDSEDSEQEVKSCSHCGITRAYDLGKVYLQVQLFKSLFSSNRF